MKPRSQPLPSQFTCNELAPAHEKGPVTRAFLYSGSLAQLAGAGVGAGAGAGAGSAGAGAVGAGAVAAGGSAVGAGSAAGGVVVSLAGADGAGAFMLESPVMK